MSLTLRLFDGEGRKRLPRKAEYEKGLPSGGPFAMSYITR